MKINKTRELSFMAFYIALALTLEYVSKLIPFEMYNGGKIELHVVALFLAAFHLGWKKGGIVAISVFALECILGMNSWLVNIPQILCDYVLPLLFCGVASLYYKGKGRISICIVIAMLLKYMSHVFAGAVFWNDGVASGSWAAWSFSMGYNLWYNVGTLIAALILVPILLNVLKLKNKS